MASINFPEGGGVWATVKAYDLEKDVFISRRVFIPAPKAGIIAKEPVVKRRRRY